MSTQSTVLTFSSKVVRANHEAKVLSVYSTLILARKCVVMSDQPPFSLWACACMWCCPSILFFPLPKATWKVETSSVSCAGWPSMTPCAYESSSRGKKWTLEVGILILGWSQGMMLHTGRSTGKTAPTAEKYFEVQMCHVGGFVSFFFKYSSIISSQWNLHHTDAALSWLHVFNSSVCLSPWLHWCS